MKLSRYHHRSPFVLWLWTLLLLVATVVAQARQPCVGVAADEKGNPIAGATVTCVYASPGDPQYANDRQSTVTDSRGRFRLPFWSGTAYTIWLVRSPDAEGACAVSRLRPGATGGGYFELKAEAVSRPRQLALDGLAAWRKHGALRMRLHMSGSDAAGQVVPLNLETATAELPPLPASPIPFVLLDSADARR